jgi:thioester reductase-like protein
METIFVTGVPGLLATALLPRLLHRRPDARAVCLVQPRFAASARQVVGAMDESGQLPGPRVVLVEGDITSPGLGLTSTAIAEDVTEVFHFAAVYDLGVPRDVGLRVNVGGTRAVLDFAAACPRLQRLHHVSTCYVSGRLDGRFREPDLSRGQAFNNAYEETKYLAEVEVRARLSAGLPATIYRPSIVVGDSTTGETTKYDGPYAAFQWLLRQGRVAIMPTVGRIAATRLNVVPRDFVVAAIDHLSALAGAVGRTYHLADPEPLSVAGVLEAFARVTGQRLVTVPLPHRLARRALGALPPLSRWLGLSPESLDYFVHPTEYDTAEASRDLEPVGIRVPRLPDYLHALVAYMRAHPERPAHGLR